MNGFVHNLPPTAECVKDLQGVLEIEVSHITLNDDGHFSGRQVDETGIVVNDTPNNNNRDLNNKNVGSGFDENALEDHKNLQKINEKNSRNSASDKSNCVQVKIVWFGERNEDAASVSCESSLKIKRNPQQHCFRKQKHKHRQHFVVVSANNKLRYRVCTSSSLFLDYLRSCKPIQIIVSSSSCSPTEPLGQAALLPSVLLKKFSFNIAKGHNFEHKTKIYTLYRRQQQTSPSAPLDPVGSNSVKSGEIQLRFKMLFAPSATAAATSMPMTTKHKGVLHDKQLTSSLQHHHLHHHNNCHHHSMVNSKSKVAEHVVQGEKSKRLSSQTKSEEIVEAMKKLDAKLVAYLAGETEIASKIANCEEENEVNLTLENNNNSNNNNNNHTAAHMDDLSPATKLNMFKTMKGIKLEMEALTLQPDGTKSMDLMQSEIRPMFTVECQLSNELIKNVPRHDMFHIMQFESEKFQSLTQCTRFGQEAERTVKLDLDENGNEIEMNLGRIYFTVWWREPGTCLNEMLGMGVLELTDLYNASLLEQCKRIEIQRRGRHLACLYFKITLQREMKPTTTNGQMKREFFLPKQSSCDSGDEKTPPQATDKQNMSSSDAATQQQQQNQAAQCNLAAADKTSTEKASAQNNNTNKLQMGKNNFDDETTKIRLLKGFIYANEARNLEIELQPQKFLICRRFWLDEPAAAKADDANKFNYQEQFSVINDEKFLQRVDKQYLHLELWHRMSSDDGNGNREHKVQPVGVVRIPLHQFFIAYRDAAITNHLCKGKLPVISIDSWAPIINWETGAKIGELKCLLAVGSEEQIKNLKDTRGLSVTFNSASAGSLLEKEILHNLQPLQIATTSKNSHNSPATMAQSTNPLAKSVTAANKMKKTSDLLDMLQKVLMTPQTSLSSSSSHAAVSAKSCPSSSAVIPAHLPSPCTTALKPLQPSNVKLFKFALEIQKAIGLPLNPASKAKKGSKQRNASKRFPPNEPPSTYVTFQADEGHYQTYKSHEGLVFATNIVEKSNQPQWQQRFRLSVGIDYLNNPQKRFILKVWKKSAVDIAQGRNQPTPMEDAIIGFAALDLTVFGRGLHIGGRFNIVDFNGRMNGQLEVRCQPLEEIASATTAAASPPVVAASTTSLPAVGRSEGAPPSSVDAVIDQFEQTLDLTHLNLGQAIKRKFTELEGISQRLRARLGDVTGTQIPTSFNLEQLDSWQPLQSDINDNDIDEFEHDLNTPTEGEEEAGEEKEDAGDKGSNAKAASEEERRKAQGNCENDDERSNE